MSFTVAMAMIANMASDINGQIRTYNAKIKVCMFFPLVWLVRYCAPVDLIIRLALASRLGRVVVDYFLIDLREVELAGTHQADSDADNRANAIGHQ